MGTGQARKHEYVVRGGKIIEGRLGGRTSAPVSSDSNVNNTGLSSNTLSLSGGLAEALVVIKLLY